MAHNPERAAVNQRLYLCRLHIDWLDEALQAEQLPRHIVEQALGESTLLHLTLCYRSYLREISYAYLSHAVDVESAADLVAFLQQRQLSSGEANELAALEQSSSWLSEFLAAYSHLGSGSPASTGTSNLFCLSFIHQRKNHRCYVKN